MTNALIAVANGRVFPAAIIANSVNRRPPQKTSRSTRLSASTAPAENATVSKTHAWKRRDAGAFDIETAEYIVTRNENAAMPSKTNALSLDSFSANSTPNPIHGHANAKSVGKT